MAKNFTDKQQKFLDVLFDEARGDLRIAKDLAGYSKTTTVQEVIEPLHEEIEALTRKFISLSATRAAYEVHSIVNDPTALGNKEKLAAAKEILDRAGFTKTEKVSVESASPLFILPAKNE